MDRVPPRPPATRPARAARTFELDDIDPPDAVEIDGHRYRLRTTTQLSLIEKAALNRAWLRLGKIERKVTRGQKPSEADQNEYVTLSREIATLALPDAPAELITTKLSSEQLDQVIVTFFARTATRSGLVRTVNELAQAAKAGSAARSPDSSTPMAATH